MKFIPKKFQMGGSMEAPVEETPVEGAPEEAAAPQEAGGQDPLMMLYQASMQALQSQDCQIAFQVCQGFVQLVQQAQGGGEMAPEEQGTPVFRKGGTLTRRIKRN